MRLPVAADTVLHLQTLCPGSYRLRSKALERAPRFRHVFFVLAVSAVLMNSIDSTIVAVAVPQLTSALDAPLIWVAWTITAYQLTQIIMLPLAGKLSDSLG